MFAKAFVLALLPLAVLAQSSTTATNATSTTSTASKNSTSTTSGTASTSTSTGGAGPSTCIVDCSQAAAVKNGCVKFSNVTCVCTSAQFQADAGSCIQDFCPDQLQAALALQKQQCTGKTVTGSVVSTPFTQTNLASLTGSSAQTTNTSPAGNNTNATNTAGGQQTSTSSAGGHAAAIDFRGMLTAAGVLVLGSLIGGVAVL